jgi:SAM-dependent methyltransferase
VDDIAKFKQAQKEGWAHFAPLEALTTPVAARLVRHAGVTQGIRVLDVGCGTGVVAITAAQLGAHVQACDLTPQLLERARENARIAEVEIEFREADVEELPFGDGQFDMVISQFAHIFAPRPEVAIREMLRVLRSGGTVAFATWPPEMLVGRTMAISGRYMPPPLPGVLPPTLWGEPGVVRERLGNAVRDIVFNRDCMLPPALSPQHYRTMIERTAMSKLIELLSGDPERLRAFRQEFDAVAAQYFRDNTVRQDYLPTRAQKV